MTGRGSRYSPLSMLYLIRFVFYGVLIGGVVVGFILVGIPLCTWVYVKLHLSRAGATVLEKRQDTFDRSCGSWHQSLQLHVDYTPSDTRGAEQGWITVDEGTFVQSQVGSRVEISYVPVALLRQIPWYTTKGLAEPLPPLPRALDVQRSASAVVKDIYHVTEIGPGDDGGGCEMGAWQPFDMVEFTFVPEGKNEALTAYDSVDSASMLNLAVGKPVTVNYSSSRPLAAKIAGANREHIWKNSVQRVGLYGLLGLPFVVVLMWVTRKARLPRALALHLGAGIWF